MPKRSNDFQKLVFYFKKHSMPDTYITESKIFVDKQTNSKREVDITIETKIGTHNIVISLECIGRVRKADITWVEQMVMKHKNLPTNLLVLISKNGFTKTALISAEKNNVETATFTEIQSESPDKVILNFKNLTLKIFEIKIEAVKVTVLTKENSKLIVNTVPDTIVFFGEREYSFEINRLVYDVIRNKNVRDYFLREGNESHKYFIIEWIKNEESTIKYYLEKIDPKTLEEIKGVKIQGQIHVEVHPFSLRKFKHSDTVIVWV